MRRLLLSSTACTVLVAFATPAEVAPNETPEKALHCFFEAVKRGDRALYETCVDLKLMGQKSDDVQPTVVSPYTITKQITYGPAEVRKLGTFEPPAHLGDVELQVRRTIEDRPVMYSYLLRKSGGLWRIYQVLEWGGD